MTDQPEPSDHKPPQAWLDALARSEAELAAGHIVSGEAMRQRLRDSIARMNATFEAEPVPTPRR